MAEPATHQKIRRPHSSEVDAVLAACRLLVAITVQALATVEQEVNVIQLRILVVLASRGVTSLSELATATGMHLSNASRTCDRMVRDGLLARTDDPDDRRSLQLTLTDRGAGLVRRVGRARRAAVKPILARMPARHSAELVSLLEEFTAAGGEPPDAQLWGLGWAT